VTLWQKKASQTNFLGVKKQREINLICCFNQKDIFKQSQTDVDNMIQCN